MVKLSHAFRGLRQLCLLAWISHQAVATATAQALHLPTANRALFEKAGEDRFFVGTIGKPWTSGGFGCVRSEGWQLHEGLDVRCRQHDQRGEPLDPILATADGTVAYANTHPGLSNFGNYLILRHSIDGLEIYSLYAHLASIQVQPGQSVRAGEAIAKMGRTANTHEGISQDRAHLHFELDLLANPRFAAWQQKKAPGQRNDHGAYNGQNLLGVDPRMLLLWQQQLGAKFNLVTCLRAQTELCRVLVRTPNLAWAQRYPALTRRNPVAEKEGVAGYELALTFNGMPFEVIPRAAAELKGKARYWLRSVNDAEQAKNPCGKLVTRKSGGWRLTAKAEQLLDLLMY
jgi:murein DD-endopeptidase MepM/ murein hydrolase activator NlpD